MRGVTDRSDDHKIVPRDLTTPRAVAVVHELLLSFGVMNQKQVGVSTAGRIDRLAGALGNHMDRDPRPGREWRNDCRQQSGIFNGRCRSKHDRLCGRWRMEANHSQQHRRSRTKQLHTSSLPAVLARPANAKTVALIDMLIPTSTAPSASANDRSPWLVCRAIAVVIVRVSPRMLPPTSITAPTSDTVRPKPARTAVKISARMIRRICGIACTLEAPSLTSSSP